MILSVKDYRDKTLACWLGKNIGGTLGAPMEWRRQKNNVSFYTQKLSGEPLPNDDLDIQLLWLIAVEECGLENIDGNLLGDYWTMYVTPHWAEYGNAKINMKSGLMPPLSGAMNNPFKDSCGSFIRSEIWAAISPGNPELAAKLAYEDGIIDHGNGEGLYAEIFCAALEAAAYVEGDIDKLIEIGLSYIPDCCGTAKAVLTALDCYKSNKTPDETRDEILLKHRGSAFMNCAGTVAKEDIKKGFHIGQIGYDTPSNIAIVIAGLLYGEGDFGKSICTAVNFGEDTDCTAATVASIFGIIHGLSSIPNKWIEPIGRKIKTACLNLGELGYFGNQLPSTIDELTERVLSPAKQASLRFKSEFLLSETEETNLKGYDYRKLLCKNWEDLYFLTTGPIYKSHLFTVGVDYDGNAVMKKYQNECGTTFLHKTIKLKIKNIGKTPEYLNLRWITGSEFEISPCREGKIFFSPIGNKCEILHFDINICEKDAKNVNRGVIELTMEGRSFHMIIPVILIKDLSQFNLTQN